MRLPFNGGLEYGDRENNTEQNVISPSWRQWKPSRRERVHILTTQPTQRIAQLTLLADT